MAIRSTAAGGTSLGSLGAVSPSRSSRSRRRLRHAEATTAAALRARAATLAAVAQLGERARVETPASVGRSTPRAERPSRVGSHAGRPSAARVFIAPRRATFVARWVRCADVRRSTREARNDPIYKPGARLRALLIAFAGVLVAGAMGCTKRAIDCEPCFQFENDECVWIPGCSTAPPDAGDAGGQ